MSTSNSFIDLRVHAAEQFKASFSSAESNSYIYFCVGKVDAWANDAAPDNVVTTENQKIALWNNMIGGKRIASGDMVHVIPRFDWTANTVYIAYDQDIPNLHDGNTAFYVVTDDYNVYKCLSNNNSSGSTVKPASVNPLVAFQTTDGYIWKYMYSIQNSDRLRFMNESYIPVKHLDVDTGSLQWSVQRAAIPGAIYHIEVLDGGSNYSSNSVTVTITGDGNNAIAVANVNTAAQTISSITMINNGTGYSYANVSITSAFGSGANARAKISPAYGHGRNALYELGGKDILINARLRFSENDKLPLENEYRQVSIIKNPMSIISGNTFANAAFSQFYSISTSGVGSYESDEWVYQGGSLANYTFKGKVVRYDGANGIVYTVNNDGVPSSSALIGANSTVNRSVTANVLGELLPYTGRILYINNIQPVTRDPNQQESFQILIRF